jgi:hypothetical protein
MLPRRVPPRQLYAITTRVRDAIGPPIRYISAVHQRDTTPDAAAVQAAVYRRMTSDQRTRAAAEMSAMARSITLENIRARHPEYGEHHARMALYRLLVGELFGRAWPGEPLLAP